MIKLGSSNIGSMYLGNNSIGKAYLGSNLIYQKGSSSTAIAYIRGGADGSYIDTGIVPDDTTKIVIVARNFNPSTNVNNWLFGSRVSNNDSQFGILTNIGVGIGQMSPAFGSTMLSWTESWGVLSNFHKYELSNQGLFVDNTLFSTVTASAFSSNYSIHLFGVNDGGNHYDVSLPIDICSVKIYKGGNMVRNFTPRNSPSVCFYDSVSNTVFTNAGQGSFTYGTFDMTGYTPLQYVDCQSAAYIDTGIKGSYALPIVVKFRPSSSNTGYAYLLGGRTSNTSGRCDFQIGNSSLANAGYYFDYQTTTNTVYNSDSQTGNDLVWVKYNNTSSLYKSGSELGTATGASDSSFTTTYNMFIGALNNAGTAAGGYRGRIYYVGMGSSKNFVPMEHSGVAGLYDTYNDTFMASISGDDFVAGPTI